VTLGSRLVLPFSVFVVLFSFVFVAAAHFDADFAGVVLLRGLPFTVTEVRAHLLWVWACERTPAVHSSPQLPLTMPCAPLISLPPVLFSSQSDIAEFMSGIPLAKTDSIIICRRKDGRTTGDACVTTHLEGAFVLAATVAALFVSGAVPG